MPSPLFTWLWAFALLMDLMAFRIWLREPIGIILLLCTALVLFWPGRGIFFGLLCITDLAHFLWLSPATPNHAVLRAFVDLAFLLTWLTRKPADFLFVIRGLILAVYGISFLHKLNSSFLDSSVSCASELTLAILRRLDLAPQYWSNSLPAYATLAFEAFIPLLLLAPHLLRFGLLAAIFFHGVLALAPVGGVYSFSAAILAGLVSFLKSYEIPLPMLFLRLAALPVLLGTAAGHFLDVAPIWLFRLGSVAWWLIPACLLLLLAKKTEAENTRHLSWLSAGLFLLFLLNGLAPYLGLHTVRTFSMFSNLRTEGGITNHLLISSRWQWFAYQRDLVEIVESNDPSLAALASRFEKLPLMELRRRMRPGIKLTYIHGGQTLTHPESQLEPVPLWLRKWLAFRAVSAGRQAACVW